VADLTAGVGDLRTGEPVPVDGQVRIASNTKTFVAVVVLQLVSTPRELLEFSTALLGGELLTPESLARMQATVPAPEATASGDASYGLGLQTVSLSCGGTAWTHGGDIPGFETRGAVAADGRGAVLAVTALPTELDQAREVEEAVDAALCA
jgi:D-alanyl-D-alanine carboxypeptidase